MNLYEYYEYICAFMNITFGDLKLVMIENTLLEVLQNNRILLKILSTLKNHLLRIF